MKWIKHPWLFLLLSFVITIVIKIPQLGLPYFFDETFSYYPAILEMAKTVPGMLPGTIPLILSKGHPLFFYFITSIWVKYVAGYSIVLTRIFPLLISLFALFVFHRFARRHTNIVLANISVILLSIQAMFLAQASLVLPEMLLFSLLILTFDSYLSGKYALFAIFSSLMILTKETGAVFILVFGLCFLYENRLNWRTKRFWKEIALISTPALVYGIFLLLHRHEFGSFFFNEHLDYITTEQSKLIYKFNSSVSILFTRYGRNVIFFSAVIALIFLLIKKKKIEFKRFLIITLFLLVFFLTFTILNFYTYRYVLPVLGLVLLASLVLIQQVQTKYHTLNISFIVLLFIISGYYSASKRGSLDIDLGYIQYLRVQKEMVQYCEQQCWYNKEFGAGYNLTMGMRDSYGRYLNTDKNFKTHHLPGIKDRDYIIYDSTCWPYEMPKEEKDKLILIKRFEYKKHWGEIYQVESRK